MPIPTLGWQLQRMIAHLDNEILRLILMQSYPTHCNFFIGCSSSASHADDMIALEHQTVAVDVDLALAVDQSRRWCAKSGNDLLTTQNVVAVALC